MNAAAFDGFVEPWLIAARRLALAAAFAGDAVARRAFLAPRVLLGELIEAAVAMSDERVTEAKLSWWQEEAAAWAAGTPRHPLAIAIAVTTASQPLLALLAALRRWLDGPAPSDPLAAWHLLDGVAAAAAWLAGEGADGRPAWQMQAYVGALEHSLRARVPLATVLPMNVRARHQLKRSELGLLPAQQRAQLLRDALAGVPWHSVPMPPGPAAAALWALDSRHLARCARGRLDGGPGFADAFAAWRAARRAIRQ